MGIILRRLYIPFILFIVIIEATDNDYNETSSTEDRQSRSSGRIVKLYSGPKPEPIICSGEGFQKDPYNCGVFYRCMKSGNGKYTVFRFQCGPGTVYDPDTEVCNHPRSTKRSECGGFLPPIEDTTHINEIESMNHEIPSPIITNRPIYIASSSTITTTKPLTSSVSTTIGGVTTPSSSPYPWGSSISNIYIDNGATAYPTTPFTTLSVTSFTTKPTTTLNVPHSSSRDNICTSDGFMGDTENCRKFYRCVANQRGGYTRYEFSCTETTIWDDDNQICNHVWAVKRTKCGYRINKIPTSLFTTEQSYLHEKVTIPHNIRENKSNSSIQQQLQISYGSKVTQTQTQISNGPVIQNQTQIHYGDRINQSDNDKNRQNQTQVSHGSAISQTQTQINYGNGAQTQLQIDHSNEASQSQVQINEPSKPILTSTDRINSEINHTLKNNECFEAGYFADNNDCQKFYRCVENGRGGYAKYEFSCSDGTAWDQNIQACNHAWAVKECGSKTPSKPTTHYITTSTYKTTHSSQTTTSTENYQIMPEPEDIEDSGYQGPAPILTTSTSTTTTSTVIDDAKKGGVCTSSGFMGDDNDCKIFYRCVENGNGGYVRHEFKCGEGTVWDSEVGACNHAWAVKKCGGSTSLDVTDTTTKKPSISSSNQLSSTTAYYPTTSTEYYQLMPEAVNTEVDQDNGYQRPEQKPALSSSSTTTTSTVPGDSKTGECTASGFMGDDNDCKIFYRCVENGNGGYVKHEFKCGEGTVWDAEISACNHAWAVKKCGGSVSPVISETETTTKKLTTSYLPSSSVVAHTTTQIAATIDNSDDHDVGYGPSHNDIPTTMTSPKPPQNVNPQSNICKSNGFVGDRYDCKKFYRCVDNGKGGYITYEFTCGEGTVWDSKIDACNHAWAVNSCGESSPADNVQDTAVSSGSSTEFTKEITTSTPRMTTSTTEFVSTDTNGCTQSGYMGDPNNCKKFFRCVDRGDGFFLKYEYSCGEGTLWDQDIEACNHAWAVTTCGSSVASPSDHHETTPEYHATMSDDIDNGYPSNIGTESGASTSDQTSSTTDASKEAGQSNCTSNGFIGDKNDCKKFYRCVDDGNGGFIRYEFNCGDGTVWDQSIEACNHAWAVKECGNADTTKTPNESTIPPAVSIVTSSQEYPQVTEGTVNVEKESSGQECTKEGFVGDLDNCKIFYRCVGDGKGSFTKYEFSCGEGTYWNQEILSCDHITSDKECGEKGNATTAKIPQYDTTSKVPQYDETYVETTTSSKDENYLTSKPAIISEICTSEGFYGHQKDCRQFYRCVDNGQGGYTKYDFTCGDGTVWDQDLQICNHESGKCPSSSSSLPQTTASHSHQGDVTTLRTTTETKYTSTSTTSSTTSKVKCDDEGFFADPKDCRVFIRCVKDDKGRFTKYQFTCAEGTVWVQEILACDYDTGETQCSSQTGTKPSSSEDYQHTTGKYEQSSTGHVLADEQDDKYNNSSTASESDVCSLEGYYGNKDDCRKFYRCVDNGDGGYTKYEFSCSEGTAWDSNIQTCNHIDQVPSCQGSILHDEDNTPTTQSSVSSSQSSSSTSASSTTQKNTESSKPTSETSTPNSQKTETCNSEGFFGNSQDCKKFYRCVDNGNGGYTKYDFTCGEGTIWDQDLTTCNHPGDVAKPSCVSTDNGSTTDSSSENASSSGVSSSTTESTTKSQSQSGTSNKPENDNINCTKAGFYANPNDCKKFYRCVDWDGDGTKFSVYHFECGEGTIWDPALDTCNHEESVYPPRNCNGSQSQTEGQSSTTESTTIKQEQTTSESTTTKTTEQSSTTTESTTSESTTTKTTEQSSTTTESTTSTTTTEKSEEGTTTTETGETTTKQSEENTTKSPGETNTEQSTTESTTATQTESTTEKQVESTTEKQGESTTEQSSEGTTEKQAESTTEKLGESTTEQSEEGTTGKTTESTTEEFTQGTTQKLDESTTEQAEGSTTEQTEGTTQETTTESSKSEQSTTEESSSEKSTTEQSTTETSTDENSGNKECPETEEDQYLFVCPSSFRRHPKYCNLFYQCDENEETHDLKIAVFTCPNGTIYDESQTKCVEESKAQKQCDGEIAQKHRVKRRNRIGENDPIVVSKDSYACPDSGYYPFEKDGECSPGFLKCKGNKTNKLRAFVYQCPEDYIFWSVSRRCERIDRVRDCRRSVLNSWNKRWEIPIENKNVAWT